MAAAQVPPVPVAVTWAHPSSGRAADTGASLTRPLEASLPTSAMETRIPCLILPQPSLAVHLPASCIH